MNRMHLEHRPLNPFCPSSCLSPFHKYAYLPILASNQSSWEIKASEAYNVTVPSGCDPLAFFFSD